MEQAKDRPIFGPWLRAQVDRQDQVGDLARDYVECSQTCHQDAPDEENAGWVDQVVEEHVYAGISDHRSALVAAVIEWTEL